MIYQARINKRVSNIKVYGLLKNVGKKENFMTKMMTSLFIRIFTRQRKTEQQQSAIERLK